MISKFLRSRSGSALIIALVIVVLILLIGVGLITRTYHQSRIAKRNFNESRALVSAHSYAALLKQELLSNYENYKNQAAWASCKLSNSIEDFLKVVNDPGLGPNPAGCQAVNFTFNYFVTLAGAAQTTLSTLKTTRFKPADAFVINGFSYDFGMTDFNLNSARNSIGSNVILATASTKEIPLQKNLRMVVDVKRTLSSPTVDSACYICRTVPGAICCSGEIRLAYLHSSGQIVEVLFDEAAKKVVSVTPMTTAAANPRAITIRNLETVRKDYEEANFCVSGFTGPVRYVIDTATTNSGDNYHLTTHGKILKNGMEVAFDPKLQSIAFDDSRWLMLRSDGQVFKASNIADMSTWTSIPGLVLPTAQRLVVGKGPTAPCP